MRSPMRAVILVLLAAALGVSSAFLVACGDRNDLIPRSDANAINADLDQASRLYAQEECRAAQGAVIDAQGRADELPDGVDQDLTATLKENLDAVLERIRSQCGRRTTQTQTTQTTTQTTPTTATQETTTETEPPTTTTEPEPAPTTTEEEPEPDSDNSGGTPSGLRKREGTGG
jgi:outer membrane biosynthesis protein TonB